MEYTRVNQRLAFDVIIAIALPIHLIICQTVKYHVVSTGSLLTCNIKITKHRTDICLKNTVASAVFPEKNVYILFNFHYAYEVFN